MRAANHHPLSVIPGATQHIFISTTHALHEKHRHLAGFAQVLDLGNARDGMRTRCPKIDCGHVTLSWWGRGVERVRLVAEGGCGFSG